VSKAILVVGSLNADIIVEIHRMPKQGETIAARNDKTGYMIPGGKGANQATAIARASGSATSAKLSCVFGNDGHADELCRTLVENKVFADRGGLSLNATCPSGQAFIFLEPNGENSIIIVGAANNQWPKELHEDLKNAIKSAGAVLLQQEIPPRVNLQVAKFASEAKVPVMMDVGGEERTFPKELLESLELISPNETELARATGMKTDTKEQCVEAARELIKRGCGKVLVTLGKDGAVLVSGDTSEDVVEQGCWKVDPKKIVDTTGAGDCFRGAFAVAQAEGKSPKESLRFATAASALCIQVKGAQPSMPTRDKIVALLQQG